VGAGRALSTSSTRSFVDEVTHDDGHALDELTDAHSRRPIANGA